TMAEEDALPFDNFKGCACSDYPDARVVGGKYNGSNQTQSKNVESVKEGILLNLSTWWRVLLVRSSFCLLRGRIFKHSLSHGKDDLSLVQLGSHLRIEESLREQKSDKGKGKEVARPSVNMMKEGGKNKKPNKTKERNVVSRITTVVLVPTRNLNWNVGSVAKLVTLKRIAVVETGRITQVLAVRERGLRTNSKTKVDAIAWWIDSGATTHVYESNKYILSKSGMFVGFGYYNSGMFILNLNKFPDDSCSVYMSSSTIVNSSLWQARLEHESFMKLKLLTHHNNMVWLRGKIELLMVNSMLSYSGLSEGFWGEAMLTACYLLIRAVVRLPDPKRKTLGERGINCIFVGYAEHSKAYRDDHSNDVPSETPEPHREAIDDEICSIMENNTWVLSDLPPGCKPLGCKWIFKRKMKVDGTIDKFKARLVIQDFRQKEGIDYFDTYAPVARITTIGILLALAAIHNLQLEGFVMPGNEHKVCKLVKSLYGLKQAPKQWHQKFDEVVLSSGFLLNQSDKCVYSKFDDSDKGEADVILGIKIKRKNKGIVITQSHYIEKILKKFNREDCSPVSTPMDSVEKLMPNTASKKQTCITGSTIESEFVALTAAGKKEEWLRNLIHEIPIWPKPIALISIHCDSAPHWLELIVKCIMASLDT
ncbi:zinc finger, CCHC-type containing protein, partial [Tanacetum coccineum]